MSKDGISKISSLVSLIYPVIFLIFIGRIIYIHSAYEENVRQSVVNAQRGTIFFSDKNNNLVVSAHDVNTHNIIVDPQKIEDPNEVFEAINHLIPTDREFFFDKIKEKNTRYRILHLDVSKEIVEKLESNIYGLRGVFIEKKRVRKYPFQQMASQVIGYVGFSEKNKKQKGLYGLERYYEQKLTQVQEPFKQTIFSGRTNSNDVVTLIEPIVQNQLLNTLTNINKEYNSIQTIGVIIRPEDGGIIAMESYPNFNPNNIASLEMKDLWLFKNPTVENTYEFGSVFKPLTIAIGLESEGIDELFTYDDKGFLTIDKRTIKNHDEKIHGNNITLQTILDKSLNLGVANIVLTIGVPTFKDYINRFRFESETGVTLPNEQPGKTNLNSPRTIEYITTSYGQGIAISPLALTQALSTLANGGFLIHPRIIATEKPQKIQSIFSKSTVQEVTRLLVNAYDEALLGGTLKNPRYSIAGKTGTAFLGIDTGTREYKKDVLLHSFFGYFPASNPQYLVLLVTIDPKTTLLAGDTLARPFSELSNFIIDYYAISPDR